MCSEDTGVRQTQWFGGTAPCPNACVFSGSGKALTQPSSSSSSTSIFSKLAHCDSVVGFWGQYKSPWCIVAVLTSYRCHLHLLLQCCIPACPCIYQRSFVSLPFESLWQPPAQRWLHFGVLEGRGVLLTSSQPFLPPSPPHLSFPRAPAFVASMLRGWGRGQGRHSVSSSPLAAKPHVFP